MNFISDMSLCCGIIITSVDAVLYTIFNSTLKKINSNIRLHAFRRSCVILAAVMIFLFASGTGSARFRSYSVV